MPWSDRLRILHNDYAGVICATDLLRLAVSSRGASYILQEKVGENWEVFREFNSVNYLRVYLSILMFDPPASFIEAAGDLPESPLDCSAVPCRLPVPG